MQRSKEGNILQKEIDEVLKETQTQEPRSMCENSVKNMKLIKTWHVKLALNSEINETNALPSLHSYIVSSY